MGDDEKEELEELTEDKVFCELCGSKYIYVLKNGIVVCRKCGHRKIPDDINPDKLEDRGLFRAKTE